MICPACASMYYHILLHSCPTACGGLSSPDHSSPGRLPQHPAARPSALPPTDPRVPSITRRLTPIVVVPNSPAISIRRALIALELISALVL